MKTFLIKNYEMKVPGIKQVSTIHFIKECLNSVPEGGFSYDDLKNRQRIEDACTKAVKGSIELEDNDALNLQKFVNNMRWGVRHDDIMDFCEVIEKMK